MTFANPLALYGLWLTAIPIAIHLFNLRRAKKIYFSNVAALEAIQTSTNSINRIKSLLILLFRILFISLLTLAFAQPGSTNSAASSANPKAAFLLDNSQSMQNEKAGKPLLNLAVSLVQKAAGAYPRSTRFLMAPAGIWQEMDLVRLQEKLPSITFSNQPKAIAEQIELLNKAALKSPGKTDVYIISDFQKSTAGTLSDIAQDTSLHYYMMPLSPDTRENIAVDSAWLQIPYLQAQIPNTITARIRNYGLNAAEKVSVALWIGQTQVGIATSDINPGGFADVDLPILVKGGGLLQGRVEVQDAPLSFDNAYHFSVGVAPPVVVSHISDKPTPYIKAVYADTSFFDYAVYGSASMDFARIAGSDLVVVEDIAVPTQALGGELSRALERGAAVVVFPSPKNTPSQWESIGATFRQATFLQSIAFDVPNEKDPFFSQVFEELPQASLMPQGKPLLIPTGAQPLLSLKDATPFTTLKTISKGKLYQFAAPLDKEFTDLHLNGLFVPLMFKIAFSGLAVNERIAYRFGAGYALIPIKGLAKNDLFALGKGGYIPEQRASASGLTLAIPTEGVAAGTYPLVRTRDDSTIYAIALNHTAEESKTEYYSADELKELFSGQPNVSVLSEASIRDIASQIRSSRTGTPLWKWLVIGALLALAAETVLIRASKAAYR